jgi:succinate dehydrogenase (ubiquinone) cytochrome b560 subunit
MNGMRHLVWDTGRMLTNKQISRSGWTVVGASTVVAVLLALWKPKKDDA